MFGNVGYSPSPKNELYKRSDNMCCINKLSVSISANFNKQCPCTVEARLAKLLALKLVLPKPTRNAILSISGEKLDGFGGGNCKHLSSSAGGYSGFSSSGKLRTRMLYRF